MNEVHDELGRVLTKLISETNGVSLGDTLELATQSVLLKERSPQLALVEAFRDLVSDYDRGRISIDRLLEHPVGMTLGAFLRRIPIPFQEEHIHLTGSLEASFVYPRLAEMLEGPHAARYEAKIVEVYGEAALPIRSVDDVDRLIRPRGAITFQRYLQLLTLPKLVLVDRAAHADAAYHMARTLYRKHNVGRIRLKFSLSRATSNAQDALPGTTVSPEDTVLGLYEGFTRFRSEEPRFDFILSPSFRKESFFYDRSRFSSKGEDFANQIDSLLAILTRHPEVADKLTDVDTVGDELNHYRKAHFQEMRLGFRKLQYRGIQVRSHHGETWRTLKHGVQAVDNAMNIWHIDTLEHGVSLGVNPNYYFHMIFEQAMEANTAGLSIDPASRIGQEVAEMDWGRHSHVSHALLAGEALAEQDLKRFIKTKFHTACEVEHYQHDVLNRMLNKGVGLVALPSSNIKLTGSFPTYKDHPFSWWEKKGVQLGVGTDNYITLNTNFVREMLILLFTDMDQLKLTKLLMVVTGENRRPVISRMLWEMR